jgi:alkylation response protein AidB-like acyl-CoA dehydrogenase
VARRAIDALRDLATEKKRGYGAGTTIADRPAVQRLISESDLRLRAARLLCVEILDALFASCENGPPPAALVAEGRAAATFVTDEALAVTSQAFRQAGGTAVYLDSIFQRSLRDLYVIQSHFVVSETSYEQHGQVLLGSDENVGMGQ